MSVEKMSCCTKPLFPIIPIVTYQDGPVIHDEDGFLAVGPVAGYDS